MENYIEVFDEIKSKKPLIHCLTNHININDSANIILAGNGQPIMAEHPLEVESITESSDGLMINFGNINSERHESMLLSYKVAIEKKVPILIDVVGCGCSQLRRDLFKSLLEMGSPSIIKGNFSEILSLYIGEATTRGVDSNENHKLDVSIIKELASTYETVVIATGKLDVITDRQRVYICENGHELMSRRTGTGCVGSALTATYMASGKILESALLGTCVMGIIGEKASANISGEKILLGSIFSEMISELYNLNMKEILRSVRVRELTDL